MKKDNKALYEQIMKNVSQRVKQILNELSDEYYIQHINYRNEQFKNISYPNYSQKKYPHIIKKLQNRKKRKIICYIRRTN